MCVSGDVGMRACVWYMWWVRGEGKEGERGGGQRRKPDTREGDNVPVHHPIHTPPPSPAPLSPCLSPPPSPATLPSCSPCHSCSHPTPHATHTHHKHIPIHPQRIQHSNAQPRPALSSTASTPVPLAILPTSRTPSTSHAAAARTTGLSHPSSGTREYRYRWSASWKPAARAAGPRLVTVGPYRGSSTHGPRAGSTSATATRIPSGPAAPPDRSTIPLGARMSVLVKAGEQGVA